MRRVLLGTFAGFLVTLVIGFPLGILLPFIGVFIGMLAGGFVAGLVAGGVLRGALAGLLAGIVVAVVTGSRCCSCHTTWWSSRCPVWRSFRCKSGVGYRLHRWRNCCIGRYSKYGCWPNRWSVNSAKIYRLLLPITKEQLAFYMVLFDYIFSFFATFLMFLQELVEFFCDVFFAFAT